MTEAFDPDSVHDWLAGVWPASADSDLIKSGVNDDDCAVLKLDSSLIVVTTDYVNHDPIVLELGIGHYRELGRLLVASNLSDLCGTGARPRALLVGIMLSRHSSMEDFKELVRGADQEAKKWNVPIAGGDTKIGHQTIVSGTAIGSAERITDLFLAHDANPGDLIWSSGHLGSCAAAALGIAKKCMPAAWTTWAKQAITVPDLPLKKSQALSRSGFGNAGTDISDGLGADLEFICKKSHVGATIRADAIPVASEAIELASELKLPPWAFAFASGGDFQFLVTTPETAKAAVTKLGLTEIGTVTQSREMLIEFDHGQIAPLPTTGHKDVRGKSFVQEIAQLVSEASNAKA